MKKIVFVFMLAFVALHGFAQDNLIAQDKELTNVVYPFGTKSFTFQSQNQSLKMVYLDVLPPNYNGKNVLLLHGKNFNAAYWEQTIKALTGKGFRVIAPDQIGFGKSTKPEHYQYSFAQLATNTKALLDELKVSKVTVLGHSMGGMLATRFILMFPETAEKLVLENPIGLEDYMSLTTYLTVDQNYKNELKNTAESYRSYQLRFYYDNKWKPEYDRWLNLLAGWTLHSDYPLIAWNAALTADMIYSQPVVYEFKNIKCPTLLIIGTRDRTALGKDRAKPEVQPTMGLYYELGKKTQQAIPGSKLVELDNVGHLPHIEAFDRFIMPLEDFLEQ